MAFPTGYLKFQSITIDHTKVAGDLTDYVVYVNLADLVKAGADIFDTCRTDGGDIRATKNDGTTELAVEVVTIDTTAKTGEVHIKFSGTLSSSTDTVIKIWYNGTDTMPATTDTYGRNAVWGGFSDVWHFQSAGTDSTSTGKTLSAINAPTHSAGKLSGNGFDNGTSTDKGYRKTADLMGFTSATQSFRQSIWFNLNTHPTGTGVAWIMNRMYGESAGTQTRFTYNNNSGSPKLVFQNDGGGSNAEYTVTLTIDTWYNIIYQNEAGTSRIYFEGALVASGTISGSVGYSGYPDEISFLTDRTSYAGGCTPAHGDEGRLIVGSYSTANWITTEYNNQSSASTFYSTSAEAGGATTVSPSAQVATFSTPARTIIRGVVLQATTQVATFTVPQETVLTSVRVNPATQLATFTIPAYGISASAVIFNATAQVSTFTVPAYTVLRGSVFSPDAQSITFTVPSPVVATGNTVSVEPVVLTFTIPALQFIGALWRRSARSSADWTRSPINND